MTLSVVEQWAVRGLDGPLVKVGPKCSNPSCNRFAEHAHHLVRRSKLGGAFDWVEIDGKVVLANKCGLCVPCHEDITGRVGGHKAAIRYRDDGRFWWCRVGRDETDLILIAPLDPHPPSPEALAPQAAGHPEGPEACPFCGQVRRLRRPASGGVGRRRRKSWTILVPDDEEEDGAELLDMLVDDLALVLGIEPNASGRYYVVLPALYFAIQSKPVFVENLSGAGG